MESGQIITAIILGLIGLLLLVYSFFTSKEKGPIFSNTYLLASEEERKKIDKSAEYRLVKVVFGILGVVFLLLAVNTDDVMEAVEELELDEVHHGIAAANSDFVMSWLAKNNVQLNICPSSNVKLRVVESYSTHPIRKLYDSGIPVTINTDDMLVFNQSVSQEYLNLYNSGLMTAEELDCIRETGLKELDYYSDV